MTALPVPFLVFHSHAIAPAQFVGPGLCYAKLLFWLANRRIQPERYVQFGLFFICSTANLSNFRPGNYYFDL
jgi:hypothetical protein